MSKPEHSSYSNESEQPAATQLPFAQFTLVDEPLNTLIEWESPARPFKKREREFYTTAGSIIFLVCVILLFIKEFLLIMVLIALAFFIYILSTVQPEPVRHKLTNKGIETMGKKYPWQLLGRFWFGEQWGNDILFIEHYNGFPARLMILLGNHKPEEIHDLLINYLEFEKPEKTHIEKAGEWLQKKIPLETEPRSSSVKK